MMKLISYGDEICVSEKNREEKEVCRLGIPEGYEVLY